MVHCAIQAKKYLSKEETEEIGEDFKFTIRTEILLEETSFKGFPVVDDMECMRLYGYVRRKELKMALGELSFQLLTLNLLL